MIRNTYNIVYRPKRNQLHPVTSVAQSHISSNWAPHPSAALSSPQHPSCAVRSRQGPSQTIPEHIPTPAHPRPPTRRSATDRPCDNPMEAGMLAAAKRGGAGVGVCVRERGRGWVRVPIADRWTKFHFYIFGPPNLVIFRESTARAPLHRAQGRAPATTVLKEKGSSWGSGSPVNQCRC